MERKTAFISGASRGIGEAIAITLSKEYNVIINYAHSEEGARAVLAQCDPEGHHKMIQCDISNGEQVKAMLEEIVKEYGHLDVVVNNAGITKDNLLLRMSDADFDDVIRVNLKGTYNCIQLYPSCRKDHDETEIRSNCQYGKCCRIMRKHGAGQLCSE